MDESVLQEKPGDDTVASVFTAGVDEDVREVRKEVWDMAKFFETLGGQS